MALLVKNLPANSGDIKDIGFILGSGRSPRGDDNTLQCACPENPVDGTAWQATVHKVSKSQTWLKQLSIYACMHNMHAIILVGKPQTGE